MLSIGWTEMMIVAAVALIVVGPRDLPAMLRQIGKAMGAVRRMGNEFKAELNKVTALDEIRDIKRTIAAPLNETQSQIEKEFNSISKTGQVEPSGVIKPSDPNAESVVDEIRSAAGMGPSLEDNGAAARASIAASVTRAAQAQTAGMDAALKDESGAGQKPAPTRARGTKTGSAKPRTTAKPKTAAKPKAVAKTAAKTKAVAKTAAKTKAAAKPKTPARKPPAAKKTAPKATPKATPEVQKSDAS